MASAQQALGILKHALDLLRPFSRSIPPERVQIHLYPRSPASLISAFPSHARDSLTPPNECSASLKGASLPWVHVRQRLRCPSRAQCVAAPDPAGNNHPIQQHVIAARRQPSGVKVQHVVSRTDSGAGTVLYRTSLGPTAFTARQAQERRPMVWRLQVFDSQDGPAA
jgi:hypothetical protein